MSEMWRERRGLLSVTAASCRHGNGNFRELHTRVESADRLTETFLRMYIM